MVALAARRDTRLAAARRSRRLTRRVVPAGTGAAPRRSGASWRSARWTRGGEGRAGRVDGPRRWFAPAVAVDELADRAPADRSVMPGGPADRDRRGHEDVRGDAQ